VVRSRLGWKRDPLWKTRIANFDRIVDEDISFEKLIQESISSPGFRGVPLNYQYTSWLISHHFRPLKMPENLNSRLSLENLLCQE
jgi:hypothetical protein